LEVRNRVIGKIGLQQAIDCAIGARTDGPILLNSRRPGPQEPRPSPELHLGHYMTSGGATHRQPGGGTKTGFSAVG
jgi:hypothetical protein